MLNIRKDLRSEEAISGCLYGIHHLALDNVDSLKNEFPLSFDQDMSGVSAEGHPFTGELL
jgi:hypothetical protein